MSATITDVFALNERAGFYAGPGQVRLGYIGDDHTVSALYDVDIEHLEDLWDALSTGLLDAGARRAAATDAGIVLVAFDDASEDALTRITQVLTDRGMPVAIAARINGGRILTLDTSGARGVEHARSWVPRSALPTLDELTAQLTPAERVVVDDEWLAWGIEHNRWRRLAEPDTSGPDQEAREVLAYLHASRTWSDQGRRKALPQRECAFVAAAITDDVVQHHLVVHLADDREDLAAELVDLARYMPDIVREKMLATAAAAVYARGNQAIAACYAEAAPSDALGRQVFAAARAGVSPQDVAAYVVAPHRTRMVTTGAPERAQSPAMTAPDGPHVVGAGYRTPDGPTQGTLALSGPQ